MNDGHFRCGVMRNVLHPVLRPGVHGVMMIDDVMFVVNALDDLELRLEIERRYEWNVVNPAVKIILDHVDEMVTDNVMIVMMSMG